MMKTEHWDRIRELFDEVSRHPPEAQERVLTALCPDEVGLQNEVLSLLEHDERATPDFLAPPSFPPFQGGIEGGPDPLIGRRIGKYTIRRVIAGGGMGRVYEAEQDNPKRTVALKVVPTWAWSPAGLRRFEFEVEALARLAHPNIAQIYDAGTFDPDPSRDREGADDQSRRREPTDILPNDDSTSDKRVTGLAPGAPIPGMPYFAMEFVPNATAITEYAERHELTVRQRLELFLQLCDAVHYGHQKSVIHRDLKPANILVTPPLNPPLAKGGSGGVGQVKVIDFGIAKAIDSDVTVTTMHTEIGQLVGTLSYMSPEQCAADPLALDVRTDVYSLGVVAYQLLCGCLPYALTPSRAAQSHGRKPVDTPSRERERPVNHYRDSHGAPPSPFDLRTSNLSSPLSMLRTICEVPPIRPSTINRTLRGDLEIILLKALEKDRQKRYQSAADLARDMRHFLAREPIEARGPSLASSAFLWTRRHPILTTALAAATVGVTILATAWTTVYLAHLRPYRIEARDDMGEAVLLSFNGNVLHTWNTSGDIDATIRAQLIESSASGTGPTIALVGWSRRGPGPRGENLCAFDVASRKYNDPLWCDRLLDQDIPREPPASIKAEDFGVTDANRPGAPFPVFDIFPEVPGEEFVVQFSHRRSRRALCIYSVEGKRLFQVWTDGPISSVSWLPEAKLLVVAGQNDVVPWWQRGGPVTTNYTPRVVWAIRPARGDLHAKYVCTDDLTDCVTAEWYKCVLPSELAGRIKWVRVDRPDPSLDNGRRCTVHFCFGSIGVPQSPDETAGWTIDESGEMVPETWHKGDAFLAHERELPAIETLQLGPLPAIRRPVESSAP